MTTHVIVNSNGIRMTIDVPLMIWWLGLKTPHLEMDEH